MAKKTDSYYFDSFKATTAISLRAAKMMHEMLTTYNKKTFREKLNELHTVEHEGDTVLHEVYATLVKAFITPIDREDILLLTQNIDDITDAIEEAMIHVYIGCVDEIRPEAIEFCEKIIECCEKVYEMMDEFAEFKHSKKLPELIEQINRIEEECDIFYIGHARSLQIHATDPKELIAWREIFKCLEDCADACEHVADVVDTVVMKNM